LRGLLCCSNRSRMSQVFAQAQLSRYRLQLAVSANLTTEAFLPARLSYPNHSPMSTHSATLFAPEPYEAGRRGEVDARLRPRNSVIRALGLLECVRPRKISRHDEWQSSDANLDVKNQSGAMARPGTLGNVRAWSDRGQFAVPARGLRGLRRQSLQLGPAWRCAV